MKSILTLSLFFLFVVNAAAFSVRKTDKAPVASYKNDTTYILAIIDSGFKLASNNTNLSAYYLLRALHLSEKINFQRGIGSARYCMGNLELIRGNYEKAHSQFNMSEKIFQELKDSKRVNKILNARAAVYMKQLKYNEALSSLFLALTLEEKTKDIDNTATNMLNIGAVYMKLADYEKAKYYLRQAMLMFTQIKKYSHLNRAIANLAGVYSGQGKPDSALYFYQKANDYFETTKPDKYAQAHILIEMSLIYQSQKEYEKSFQVLEKVSAICKMTEMRGNYVKYLTQMASTYFATGQDEMAIKYANEALVITKKDNLLQYSAVNYQLLHRLYKKKNLTNLALQNLESLDVVKDTMQKANNLELMEKLDSKYLTEKLQQKELILKQQSDLYRTRQVQFYLILSLVFVLLVFISIMFYVKQQAAFRKNKILEQETEINKQKVIIHQQETALYEAELNKQKNEILAISTLQGKTNEALLQIINDLRQLAFQEIKNKPVSDTLYKMAGSIEKLSTTDSWSDFRKWFTDIHPQFYENLNKICPSLTSNDLKLASLIRMNLSSKEIASLTLRSLDSIHIARYRLRRKLDIEDDNHLINFLFSVQS